MRALLAILALLVGAALALEAPAVVEADDGAFASVPLVLDRAGDRLEVVVPEGFLLLGEPGARPGRQLLNLFVGRGVPSGAHDLRLRLWDGGRVVDEALVRIYVRPRAGFAVVAPGERRLVLGQQAEYWVRVTNTGNVTDRIRLEVRTSMNGVTLEPVQLELPPGASGLVKLTVVPRSPGRRIVVMRVRSSVNPGLERYTSVHLNVLPFSGADSLGSRALRYRLELEGGTGSQGPSYGARATMAGGLSDYLDGAASGQYAPGAPGFSLTLEGEKASVGFSAGEDGYELSAGTGPWSGGLRYFNRSWSGRLGWDDGPWSAGLIAAAARQRFTVGYRWRSRTWWNVEANASLDRYASGEAVEYAAAGRVQLGLDAPDWLAGLQATVDSAGLHLEGRFMRRSSETFGLRGYGFYHPGAFALNLQSSQRLGGPWEARETFGYFRGALGWSAGLRYAPADSPWAVGAGVVGKGTALAARVDGRYNLSAGGTLAGWLTWNPRQGVQEGVSYRLGEGATRVELYFEDARDRRLGVRLGHGWHAWTVSGAYAMRLDTFTGEGQGTIEYDAGRWAGFGRVEGDAEHLEWALGARLRLEGGVVTPDPVVQLFGGRKTGRVEGVVFADVDGDGRRDEGEPPVIQAYLVCGGMQAMSDAEGRYAFEADPGACQLSAEDTSGRYGLLAPLELRFARNRTARVDVPLAPVAGVSGEAWLDDDGNGVRDEGERPLGGAVVKVVGPDWEERVAYSDGRGRFQLGGLSPGRYRVELSAEGLPRGYAPAPPQELELRPGPLPFVGLAAVPRPQEQVRTFSVGDAALFLHVEHGSAPPGAEVRVEVEVSGPPPDEVWLEAGPGRVAMEPAGEGRFAGYLSIPADARGAYSYTVRARWGEDELEQQGLIVVSPGPLVRLEVRPAFVDPGEAVEVTARFLRRVKAAEVRVGAEVYALEPLDAFTWRVRITAPRAPGRYPVELWVGGERWAASAFRVSE